MRHDVERVALGIVQALHPRLHQLDDASRLSPLTDQRPATVASLDGPTVEAAEAEFSSNKRVATRALHDRRGELAVELAPEDACCDLLDRSVIEWPDLDALREALLPERHDRIWHRFSGADRGDHEGGHRKSKLEDERGGMVVEKVRVVDRQHQGPARRALRQRRAC
jgi:hypothetical protein